MVVIMVFKWLDQLFPPEYSEIIMTFTRKDPDLIKNYLKNLQERYNGKDIDGIRKDLVEKYKEEDYPKILIVTDMLLTGFDAPILQVMYFDKPIKEHRLLQAVARVNRPFRGVKEAGLIFDYVGIFRELEKALAIYTKEDVVQVVQNIEEERKEFVSLINETMAIFEGIDKTNYDRPTLMEAIKRILANKENTKEFEKNFKILRKKFELLGPDPEKIKFLDEFKWISAIYYAYLRHVNRVDPDEEQRYVKKYFGRTLKYIHETVAIDKIREDFPTISIDADYITKLEAKYDKLADKISDMVFALKKFMLVERTRNPIYETIVEKVDRILKERNEDRVSNEEFYNNLKGAIDGINEIDKRKIELELKNAQYATLLILEDKLGKSERLIDEIKSLFEDIGPSMFKGWSLKKSVEKEIGQIIRKKIRKYQFPNSNLDEVYDKIIDALKKSD